MTIILFTTRVGNYVTLQRVKSNEVNNVNSQHDMQKRLVLFCK